MTPVSRSGVNDAGSFRTKDNEYVEGSTLRRRPGWRLRLLLSLEDRERTRSRVLVTDVLSGIVEDIVNLIPGKVRPHAGGTSCPSCVFVVASYTPLLAMCPARWVEENIGLTGYCWALMLFCGISPWGWTKCPTSFVIRLCDDRKMETETHSKTPNHRKCPQKGGAD